MTFSVLCFEVFSTQSLAGFTRVPASENRVDTEHKSFIAITFVCALGLSAQTFQSRMERQITLIGESTSEQRSMLTNQAGEYTFSSVNPATYTVRAEFVTKLL